jgi:hypothetical protein
MKGIYKLMASLFVLDVCLFALSGIPALKDAKHGVKWVLGGVGWFGGLLVAVALIVLAIVAIVRAARSRRAVAA